MALPAGFNPNNMTFGNIAQHTQTISIPRNTSTYTSPSRRYRYHESIWSRLNDFVARIGNWIADKSDDIVVWTIMGFLAIVALSCVIAIIAVWCDEGFFAAVITTICACIGCGIAYFISFTVIALGLSLVLFGLRCLFWNAWTLLIALTIGIGAMACSMYLPSTNEAEPTAQTEVITSDYDKYSCAAAALNVRSQPKMSSRVLGTLKKGQKIEVIETKNGFAAFDFNGQRGYASLKYLNKIE